MSGAASNNPKESNSAEASSGVGTVLLDKEWGSSSTLRTKKKNEIRKNRKKRERKEKEKRKKRERKGRIERKR